MLSIRWAVERLGRVREELELSLPTPFDPRALVAFSQATSPPPSREERSLVGGALASLRRLIRQYPQSVWLTLDLTSSVTHHHERTPSSFVAPEWRGFDCRQAGRHSAPPAPQSQRHCLRCYCRSVNSTPEARSRSELSKKLDRQDRREWLLAPNRSNSTHV